jgi:hypothetical protein
MAQPVEAFIQVPPNVPGGQDVRQYQLTVLQPGGMYATVLVEAISVVDAVTGRALDLEGQEWRDEVTKLLRAMVKGLEILCASHGEEADLLDQQMGDE